MSAENDRPSGEFELIAQYFEWASTDSDVLIGPGDDAALARTSGPIAVATDTLVAGVHFLESIDPGPVRLRTCPSSARRRTSMDPFSPAPYDMDVHDTRLSS